MYKIYQFLDSIVAFIRGKLTEEKFAELEEKSSASLDTNSLTALMVVLGTGIALYFKFESEEIYKGMLMAILGLTVVGYISQKFLEGCQNIAENHKIRVSLNVYSDLGGLLFGTFTLLAFLAVLLLVKNEKYLESMSMLGMGVFLLMTTWLIINPKLIGLEVDKLTPTSTEAVSLFLLPVKVLLRSMKVLSATFLVLGTWVAFLATPMVFMSGGEDWEAQMNATKYIGFVAGGYMSIAFAMALPLITYFAYMFLSLIVDALRNVLMIGEIRTLMLSNVDVDELIENAPVLDTPTEDTVLAEEKVASVEESPTE